MRLLYLFLCITVVNCDGTSLNILTIFPFHGKSHSIIFNSLIEGLVQKGHNVTDVSFFKINKELNNYHHINLAGSMKILEDDFLMQRNYITILQIINFVVSSGNDNCKILLENKEVHNLLKRKEKFDLVLVEQFNTDCPLALAYKLGAPVVSMSTTVIMPWYYYKLGAPYNPSFVPLIFLDGETNPSLYQRIERTIFNAICQVWYKLGQRIDEQTLNKYFNDIPPLQELAKDIKMFLTYSSLMLFGTNVIPTNVLEVGGFHVAKPEPLPDKLQQFIEESEHGVIYVSFGSIIKSSASDSDKIEKIVSALTKLPQRIIWKWEDPTPPGKLDKIYVSKWLPQKDILAHPNVVAFLSHCGLVSTTEAITFGVPIVGMPVFGDQPSNAAAIEEKGFGVRIKLSELTSEHLLEKFKTVLDPNFRKKVKSLSKSWQDRPMPPMETAIFWTEFAARHPNHTFRAPAADVPLYQYLNLDILLVFVLLSFIIIFILKSFISIAHMSIGRKSNKDKKQ